MKNNFVKENWYLSEGVCYQTVKTGDCSLKEGGDNRLLSIPQPVSWRNVKEGHTFILTQDTVEFVKKSVESMKWNYKTKCLKRLFNKERAIEEMFLLEILLRFVFKFTRDILIFLFSGISKTAEIVKEIQVECKTKNLYEIERMHFKR